MESKRNKKTGSYCIGVRGNQKITQTIKNNILLFRNLFFISNVVRSLNTIKEYTRAYRDNINKKLYHSINPRFGVWTMFSKNEFSPAPLFTVNEFIGRRPRVWTDVYHIGSLGIIKWPIKNTSLLDFQTINDGLVNMSLAGICLSSIGYRNASHPYSTINEMIMDVQLAIGGLPTISATLNIHYGISYPQLTGPRLSMRVESFSNFSYLKPDKLEMILAPQTFLEISNRISKYVISVF